jgi:hypothetical protein
MVDLPTFGRPTIPQFKGMLLGFLLSLCSLYWNTAGSEIRDIRCEMWARLDAPPESFTSDISHLISPKQDASFP